MADAVTSEELSLQVDKVRLSVFLSFYSKAFLCFYI